MGKTRQSADLVSDGNILADITNDRVGIGSTVPTHKLDVAGSVKFTGIAMNSNQLLFNQTVPSNFNAMSIGPVVSVGSGVTITVSTDSVWSINP